MFPEDQSGATRNALAAHEQVPQRPLVNGSGPARHEPAVEIKGATYTALRVERQKDDTWLAQCVVDV